MALDSANVNVAVTGAVSVGTQVAAPPTTATAALGTGWTDLGYISDSGIVEGRSRSTKKITAWQFAAVVREVVTESGVTWKVTFIETKKEVVELYYASSLLVIEGSLKINPAATGGRQPFCIDRVDGTDFIRTYIPEGELVEAPGDQTSASGDPLGYSVTITGYPSVSLAGNTFENFYSALKVP